MAKVTSVSYGRLATFGRFENEKVSITLELQEGETADQAMEQAIGWVEDKLAMRSHLDESIREKQQEVARLQTLQTELDGVVERARKVIETFAPQEQKLSAMSEKAVLADEEAPDPHDDEEDEGEVEIDL